MKFHFQIQICLFLALMGLSSVVKSQTSERLKKDSLLTVWRAPNNHDTIRLNAVYDLCEEVFMKANPDSALHYASEMEQFASTREQQIYVARAKSIQGRIYVKQGIFHEAKKQYEQSLKIYQKLNHRKGEASILNNIGTVESDQGNYEVATELYMQSLRIRESIGDDKGVASCWNNIGSLYFTQGYFDKAIEYSEKSLEVRKKIGDQDGVATALNNIGMIHAATGDYATGFRLFREALAINSQLDNKFKMANTMNNIGIAHYYQGDIDSAIYYYELSLRIKEDIGDRSGVATSYSNIGYTYMSQDKYEQAINYAQKAYEIAEELGVKVLMKDASGILYKSYKESGNHSKALEMYEIQNQVMDSLENDANKRELLRQDFKYQYEKKAAADSVRAAAEAELKNAEIAAERAENAKKKSQIYWMFAVLGISLILGALIFNRYRITNKQKNIITEQKKQVDDAYNELEEKNGEIVDSINYAKRIQAAILPPDRIVKEQLANGFVLYEPKDIVAGDFYWIEPLEDRLLFAACDCTGHGVPGAMVSVVCNNALNRAVREYHLSSPSKILDKTREIVLQEFGKSEDEVKDGMDAALCSIRQLNQHQYQLEYAGAHNPLWIIRSGSSEIEEIKADKQPIGKYEHAKPFTLHQLELQPGDSIYVFSDGFADQFGGDKGKKFKPANFKKLLLNTVSLPMQEQKKALRNSFKDWQGNLEQLDDVCVIGVRV